MDNSNEAPEDPTVKNSSSSVVQVDSIYIQLPLTLPNMDIRCSCEKGFSIRGYTASKRGSTPDVSSIYPPGKELPPMEVPSFRYWRCCYCVRIERQASGAEALERSTTPPFTPEQGLQAADANEEMRAAANVKDMQQGPIASTNVQGYAIQFSPRLPSPTPDSRLPSPTPEIRLPSPTPPEIRLSSPLPPDIAASTLVQTTVTGVTEEPAEELNACAITLHQQSEEINTTRKTDSREHKRKRRHRSLADILGAKQNSTKASPVERALVSEGQQSPRRKRVSNQQEEVPTEKASKRDKGKAVVTDANSNSDGGLVRSRGEGLFIGTTEERMRDRTDVVPPPSKKKAKQTLSLGLSENITKLIRELPSPPSSTPLESQCQQQDQNHAGLSSGGFTLHTSHSKHSKLGLDLSLGTSPKRSHYQNNGAKAKKTDTQYWGSSPESHLQSDRARRKESLDLNDASAHTAAIPLQDKVDFLQLGPKEKSPEPEKEKETDPRTDDIPMDIVELLAKQQFERTKPDAVHSPTAAHGSSNSARGFPGTAASHWMRGYSGLTTSSGVGVQHAASGPSKASTLVFSQASSVPTIDTLRSALTNSLPSHSLSQRVASARGGAQYPNSLFPPPPSSLRFGFAGQPKQDGQQHRGKTISDIKADELKKTDEAAWFSFSKPFSSRKQNLVEESGINFAKPGSSRKPILIDELEPSFSKADTLKGTGAFESYGNDSIPALQLMSLMDGRSSDTSLSLGSSRIPSKPFSPCAAHPRFNKDERCDFLAGSIFSGQLHRHDPVPNPPTSFTLRPHSSAALPGHVSFRTAEVDMSRNIMLKAGSRSGIQPGSDLYIPYLHDPRVRARSLGQKPPADPKRAETATGAPRTGSGRQASADGVCRTNRNPAEFSVAEPGNMYTISSKDLNTKKRKKYHRKPPTEKAAADEGQQGSTSQGQPAAEHPKVASS